MKDHLDQHTAQFLHLRTHEEKDFSPGCPDENPYYFYAIKTGFPKIPTSLLESVDDTSDKKLLTHGSDRPLLRDSQHELSAPLRRWSVKNQLTQWVVENISDGFTNVSIQVIHGDKTHRTLGAHTDRRRRFSLFYLIEEGGVDIHTKWYRYKNQPIWQDRWIAESDYNQIDLVHSQRLEPFQWYLFNGRILHDVDQLMSTRKNIIVGFDRLPTELEILARSIER